MWLYYLAGLYLIYAIVVVRFLNTLLFKKLKFTETRDPELPENWKPFERYDRKNWRISEIYFGALFLLPIRLLIMVIALCFAFFVFLIAGKFLNYIYLSYRSSI
jgi:lysophosphatidylcholine acyltransferase/lyso-PAF acetyltransferase